MSFIIETALDSCTDFDGFSPEEKAAIAKICRVVEYEAGRNVFSIEHQERYIFIVVMGHLTLKLRNNKRGEFGPGALFGEITLFSDKGRMGAIHCEKPSTLVAMDKNGILDPGILPTELRLKLAIMLGQKVAGYLYRDSATPTAELARKGEGQHVEFKESLSQRNKIQQAIVAFMNANGGVVLVGVKNNGEIIGLGGDAEEIGEAMDALTNGIKNLTNNQAVATYFDHDIETVEGKTVVRITVTPALNPILWPIKEGNQQVDCFFVRTGTLNTRLKSPGEIIEYTRRRFL
jgi:CRP-like cAMP-binding protein